MNIKSYFTILKENKKLVYLDSANTTFKPDVVENKIKKNLIFFNKNFKPKRNFLKKKNKSFKNSIKIIKNFINCPKDYSLLFFNSATEALEFVSTKIIGNELKKDDEVVFSDLDHRSSVAPWKKLVKEKSIKLKFMKYSKNGDLKLNSLKHLCSNKTKLITLTHLSHFYGNTVSQKIIDYCKKLKIPFLVDGCQSMINEEVDIEKIGCDFFVFSSHKMYGPMGLGVLVFKNKYLKKKKKFEQNKHFLIEVEALSTTMNFLKNLGRKKIIKKLLNLTKYLESNLKNIKNIKIFGKSKNRKSIISFILKNQNLNIYQDVNKKGIFLRYGHHHCQKLMKKLNYKNTFRVSLGIYNDKKDIDYFIDTLKMSLK